MQSHSRCLNCDSNTFNCRHPHYGSAPRQCRNEQCLLLGIATVAFTGLLIVLEACVHLRFCIGFPYAATRTLLVSFSPLALCWQIEPLNSHKRSRDGAHYREICNVNKEGQVGFSMPLIAVSGGPILDLESALQQRSFGTYMVPISEMLGSPSVELVKTY